MSNEDIPKLCSEDDLLNSSSDEEGWVEFEDEDVDDNESTICLFCSQEFKNVTLAIDHVKHEHGIDFHTLKRKFNMDQYSFIKVGKPVVLTFHKKKVNFLYVIASTEECNWNDEKYLKPVSYEPWLMFDFDGLESSDGKVAPSEREQIQELLEIVQAKDSLLQQAAVDIENLRKSIHDMIQRQSNEIESKVDSKKDTRQDNGYFETYAHYGIHHDMLSDEVRTCSYRDAIIKNEETFKDKIVLDLGCGMKNNFTNIEFVKGRLEDITLPVEKVDIIVSEWMGYFLLFEGMLDSVIYARDNHPNAESLQNLLIGQR